MKIIEISIFLLRKLVFALHRTTKNPNQIKLITGIFLLVSSGGSQTFGSKDKLILWQERMIAPRAI